MIKTDNDFMFGSNGVSIQPVLTPVITTREQAFRTAAWIKLMGYALPSENPEGDTVLFQDVEEAIMET